MEEKNSVRIQRWQQSPARSVRGFPTFTSADTIRTLTKATLSAAKLDDKHQVKVRRRPDGTFDVLVFDAVAQKVTP